MERVLDIQKQTDEVKAKMLYALMQSKLKMKELDFYNAHPSKHVEGFAFPQDMYLKIFDDKGIKNIRIEKYSWKDILTFLKRKDCIGWKFVCALDEADNNRAQLMCVPFFAKVNFQIFLEAR